MTATAQFKRYLDVLYRRKWWIVVPLVLSALSSFFVLKHLPKVYRASTTILVTPQRLPSDFVRTTVTPVEDRMASMSVQILSRSFLETVLREHGLIAADASEPQIEGACYRLRSRVELSAGKNLSYFEVAVQDEDAKRSASIANRLASLFIEQNSQMRSQEASGTRSTVEGWLEKKKTELDAMEARIAEYKRGHLWEIGEQLNANLRLLDTAQQRVGNLSKDIEARQDRLADLRAQSKSESLLSPTTLAPEPDPVARKLVLLEAELEQLRVTYTDENPAVRRKQYEISEYKRIHPELDEPAVAVPGQPPVAGSARAVQIERLEKEIAALEQDRSQAQTQISSLTARINNTPVREQELIALTRGYDTAKKEYEDLLGKKEVASRAEELESSKKSEQFKVQDAARTPSSPFKPKPLEVLLICLVAGVGLGIGAVVVLEFLDQSLRTEDDFRRAFPDVILLTTVPHIGSDAPAVERPPRTGLRGSNRAAVMILVGVVASQLAGMAGWPTS